MRRGDAVADALTTTVTRPQKANGAAVVLAPGQGYHRGLPLLKGAADALAAAGFLAVTFDWRYFTADTKPSEDRSAERADLDEAIALARGQKLILAGKSMGAGLALDRAMGADLAGLALLTLPVRDVGHAVARLDYVRAPVLIVNGDTDPLCELATLHTLAARCMKPPRVVVVPGDHSFEGETTTQNVTLAIQSLVTWATQWI